VGQATSPLRALNLRHGGTEQLIGISRMRSCLLCALVFHLAGAAECEASAGCDSAQSWTQDVVDEEQAINMLQVKGSKLSTKRACPIPDFPAFYGYGKGCPESVAYKKAFTTCLDGNKAYPTFAEAWAACGRNDECQAVLQDKDNQYYLRRASDPDLPAGQGYYLSKYDCPELKEQHEQEQVELQEAEHDHMVDTIRRKQHKERVEAEIEQVRASYAENEKEEKRHAEKAFIHDIKAGGLPEDELAVEIKVLQSIQAELGELYEKQDDTACGWGNLQECQDENQAFINDGAREMTKIKRDDAAKVCGRVCQEAGAHCGGFAWDNATQSCYFRKNAGCGVFARQGQDCFKKRDPPTPIDADHKLTMEEEFGEDY